MGRRKKTKFYEELEILRLSSDGFGVAKPEEKVVFVEKAIPGDVVRARVYQNRKQFEKAKILEIITPSKDRQKPFCNHYEHCGGCKLQHLPYTLQAVHKDDTVLQAFTRLAKVPVGEILPIVTAEKETAYRNKMEYTFSATRWLTEEEINSGEELDKRALGLHAPGNYAKVVDLEKCYLQEDISNRIRNGLKAFAIENDIAFYNIVKREGMLRNLIIRSTSGVELMVLVIFNQYNKDEIELCMSYLQNAFPELTALHYIINGKSNDSYADLESVKFAGEDFITEKIGDYKFKIRPKSFFQTNIYQAKHLYDVTKEFADLQANDILYDLYSGVGSIGIYLSQNCKKVVGIEQVDQAVFDAKENARLNNLDNTHFEVGDVRSLLNPHFISQHGQPNVLVTDPPRAGMHPDVVQTLLEAEVPKLVYVSCNPSTQARDVALLAEKFDVVKMQAVDMFPQTNHIENVALLKLR